MNYTILDFRTDTKKHFGEMTYEKPTSKSIKGGVPLYRADFCGVLVFGNNLWNIYEVQGFSFLYPCIMSMTIFAGSMEFVTANMLLGAFNPIQAFIMALMVNARHLFYGISMLDKFHDTGKKSGI